MEVDGARGDPGTRRRLLAGVGAGGWRVGVGMAGRAEARPLPATLEEAEATL